MKGCGSYSHIEDRLLDRWWKRAVAASWVVCLAFTIAIGCDKFISAVPLCPLNVEDLLDRESILTSSAVLGAFVMIDMFALYKIYQLPRGQSRVPMWLALHSSLQGTFSTFLTVVFDWGGLCVDTLGFVTPAAMWGEWLGTAPLTLFIAIAVREQPDLTSFEFFMIFTFQLSLLFGFLVIVPQSTASAGVCLALAVLCYIPSLYLPFMGDSRLPIAVTESETRVLQHRRKKHRQLAMVITVVYPVFPLLYFLMMGKVIDASFNVAACHVFSMLSKGLFSLIAMDIHLTMNLELEKALAEERRANDARRAFMKYIFHEIRTPLSSLTMGVDMLRLSDHLDPHDKESLEIMHNATQFMSKTLNGVLTMHKIEEGLFELELGPCSLVGSARTVISSLTGAAAQKRIRLSLVLDESGVPECVSADASRIEHVMSNIIANAIKFSPEQNEVVITMTNDSTRSIGTSKVVDITFSVKDAGCGVSAENQALLFKNFVQIRPGLLQQGQGSGLGLSFCKQIVELHSGIVGVESAVGEGSSFYFTIPFVILDQHRDVSFEASSQQVSMMQPPTPPTGQAATSSVDQLTTADVLVVDDSPANRKMLQMLLKRRGILSDAVDDGQEALLKVSQDLHKYKVVLMDNLMPTMNGLDASKAMREAGYPYLIVGITGNAMQDDLDEYLSSGADLVLTKPVQVSVIDKIVALRSKHGVLSREGMKLVDKQDDLEWAPLSARFKSN